MMKKITLLISFVLLCCSSYGQWKPLNPGAGGQVQDVVPDPNTVNRLILASDMEGIYETLDNGQSWHAKGVLHQNRAYAVAYVPGDVNKLIVGTLYSLEVSNDGGKKFTLVPNTKGKSIGAIAVNPKNTNVIIAGVGWRDDYDFSDTFGLSQNANGELYRSADGGATWTMINYDLDSTTDRNVFSVEFDKVDGNNVYLGTGKGVFKSTDAGLTWTKIASPTGTLKNKGVTLSPDGKIMYAAYTTAGNNGYLYAAKTSNFTWTQVTAGSGEQVGLKDFWYPEVDSRSTATNQKVIVGLQSGREGLFEADFTWDTNGLVSYSWKTIWSGTDGYDNGWDNAPPNPRFVHYTPKNWDRAVWSTTNQTMFEGKPSATGATYQWNNKYSMPNTQMSVSQWGKEWPTYSGRGTESTYSYDITLDGNYMVQGQGDNGAVESWDNGFSWSNIKHRSENPPLADVQAVDIADSPAWGGKFVVAQMAPGYGGGATQGKLYAKKLEKHTPEDSWLLLASSGKGLPGGAGVLRDVAVSPVKKSRVFAYSTNKGLYMIDDIGWAYDQTVKGNVAWWAKINNGVADGIYAVKKITPDPVNADIVYINGAAGTKQGVFKGEKIGADWVWTKLFDGSGWDSEIVAWKGTNDKVYLFFSGTSKEAGNDGTNYIGSLSLDGGVTWKTVLTKAIAQGINTPDWYNDIATIFNFQNKGGAAGYGNSIIMSYYDHKMQKTYGVYKGTIDASDNVTWENFTGDLHFGGLTSTIIKDYNGKPYVFATTAGAGAWKRPLDANAVADVTPIAPTNLVLSSTIANQIDLTWVDNANNETGYRIERKEGDAYVTVATIAANTTTFSDKKLKADTNYTYRIKAINEGGSSDFSAEVTAKTIVDNSSCNSVSIIANGEFDNGVVSWVHYKVAEVTSALTVVADANLSGANAGKVELSGATGAKDSDVQLYSNIPSLKKDVTYQITFKAKAAADKPIRVGVLLGAAPWTGFLSQNVTVTTTSTTYGPFEFTPGVDTNIARLDFFLSNDNSAIWIDAVELKEKCGQVGPVAPTDLASVVKTGTKVTLTWKDNSADETGFIVERKTDGVFSNIATVAANATTYDDATAEGATTYTYRVSSVKDGVKSAYSNESVATTGVAVCGGPNVVLNGEFETNGASWTVYKNTGITAAATSEAMAGMSGTNAAKIVMEGVTGTKDSDVQFYQGLPALLAGKTYQLSFKAKADKDKLVRFQVFLSAAPWTGLLTQSVTITATPTDFGPFEFTPTADTSIARLGFFLSNDNTSVYLDAVVLKEKCNSTKPIAPSNLVAKSISSSQIDLSWTDASDNETGFVIERKTATDYVVVATVTSGVVTYSDKDRSAATAYTYRVMSKNLAGNSVASNEASATTSAGTGTGCANPNAIDNGEFDDALLRWVSYFDDKAPATGVIESDGNSVLSGKFSTKITVETTAGTDSQVQFYQKIGSVLKSGKKYELTFMAKATATKSIRIAVLKGAAPWTNFLEKTLDVTAAVATYGPFEFTMPEDISNAQFHFFLGKDDADIWVDAVSIKEKCSNIVPATPTELAAVPYGAQEIRLTWKDNSTDESGFTIERKSDGTFQEIATLIGNTNSYTDLSVLVGKTYVYRVKAINPVGVSTWSNESSAATEDDGGLFTTFSINTLSETCAGKENGQLLIVAQKEFAYKTTINGVVYEFTKDLSVGGLKPNDYSFCIEVINESFKQCFSAEISAAVSLKAKAAVIAKSATIDIEKGTAPYNVYVNGAAVLETSSPNFSIDVKNGDLIEVKSNISCEGIFAKNIEMLEEVSAYPNPTNGEFEISVPMVNGTAKVSIYNLGGQLVSTCDCPVNGGKIKLNIDSQSAGTYLVRMDGKLTTFKIVKR